MSEKFTALHISDIHHSALSSFRQEPILQAFIRDLGSNILLGRKIDLVFVSGDLVQNPDEANSYYNMLEFVDLIASKTRVLEKNILFCPGNHDISFDYIRNNTLLYQSIQESKKNVDFR